MDVVAVAAVIYMVSASVLGEKNPDAGGSESGPAAVQSKEEIVKYLKTAFTYAHRAMASLSEKNLAEMATSPFGEAKSCAFRWLPPRCGRASTTMGKPWSTHE